VLHKTIFVDRINPSSKQRDGTRQKEFSETHFKVIKASAEPIFLLIFTGNI